MVSEDGKSRWRRGIMPAGMILGSTLGTIHGIMVTVAGMVAGMTLGIMAGAATTILWYWGGPIYGHVSYGGFAGNIRYNNPGRIDGSNHQYTGVGGNNRILVYVSVLTVVLAMSEYLQL